MHPRAKATSPTGTPGPGHSNGFLWAFKAGFLRLSKLPFASPQTLQNSPNPPNPPNAPNPPKPAKPSKHRPQQAPQIHSNDSAMTFYGPQSCSLPACKGSKLPKFQTPSPTCTLGPRPLPQQAPQGQATAMLSMGFQSCRLPARKPSNPLQNSKPPGPGPQQWDFLWAFKAAVCQPANPPKLSKPSKRSKPSKTRQTLQTPSPAGTSDPQQWLSWCFQSCLNRGPGPQQWLSMGLKAAVCQPAKDPNFQNSKHLPQHAP